MLVLCMMLTYTQPVFATNNENELNQYRQLLNENYENAIKSIREQLIEQDRLDHLHIYEKELKRIMESELSLHYSGSIVRNNARSSNGGVAIRYSPYSTSIYTFIPNNQINNILQAGPTNLLEWAKEIVVDFLLDVVSSAAIRSAMNGLNKMHLRQLRDSGKHAMQMTYIDHTEGDRGSSAIYEWNNFPNVGTSYGTFISR